VDPSGEEEENLQSSNEFFMSERITNWTIYQYTYIFLDKWV